MEGSFQMNGAMLFVTIIISS